MHTRDALFRFAWLGLRQSTPPSWLRHSCHLQMLSVNIFQSATIHFDRGKVYIMSNVSNGNSNGVA